MSCTVKIRLPENTFSGNLADPKCKIVRQTEQGTQKKRTSREATAVSYWNSGYEQQVVFQSQPRRRKVVGVKNACGLHGDYAPPCHYV